MRKIFVADAHLSDPNAPPYRDFLRFLERIGGEVETLFIMGDLFHLWIGSDRLLLPRCAPALDSLRKLRRSGTGIVWLEGNHDFNLGPVVTVGVGALVHPGPVEIVIDGKRCHLCHGDQVNPHDRGYQFLRRMLRSFPARLLPRLLPVPATLRIASFLERHCSAEARDAGRYDPLPLIERYATQRFAQGAEVVVTGHFHLPLLKEMGGGLLMSVGDWETGRWYGVVDGGRWSLDRYGSSKSER